MHGSDDCCVLWVSCCVTVLQRALSSMEASSSTGTFAGGVIPPWMDMGLPPRSLSAASTSSPVNAGHQAGGVSEGDAMDRIKDSTNPSCDPPCRSASGSDNQHAGGYRWNWDALLSEGIRLAPLLFVRQVRAIHRTFRPFISVTKQNTWTFVIIIRAYCDKTHRTFEVGGPRVY